MCNAKKLSFYTCRKTNLKKEKKLVLQKRSYHLMHLFGSVAKAKAKAKAKANKCIFDPLLFRRKSFLKIYLKKKFHFRETKLKIFQK